LSDFNDRIIAEFRSNGGRVDSAGFGSALVLLHTRGARTGLERVNPAMSLRDGQAWLVVGSAMGAARDPAWAVNLRAHPDIVIEVASAGGVQTVPVTAQELDGAEYDVAFARFVRRSSAFATYQDRATTRRLPVIRLAPRADAEQPPAAAGS
jgi:deazaflavin-dependent oxidoreductase (nitroreductase family)